MRHAHVCPHCDHRSTRWWNLKIHIKRRHGGFLVGRSDRYMDSNPISFNNPYHNIGSATVADSVGNTFEPRYLSQTPLGLPQYSPSTMYRPLPTIDEQRYGSGLSQDAIQKIHKLKLMNNHHIPDGMIRLAIFNSINGDNTLLDQMWEQLRHLDSITWQNGYSIE
jgi:hypothetical protein